MRTLLFVFYLLYAFTLNCANTYLGLYLENLTSYEKKLFDVETGLRIDSVLSDSPAEKAGLKKNQIILKINNNKIINEDYLYSFISNFNPKDKISLLIQDKKLRFVKKVELGDKRQLFVNMNNQRMSSDPFFYLGAKGIPVNATIAPVFQLPPGILLTNIPNNSRADKFGLNDGDILMEINGQKVSSTKQLSDCFSCVSSAKPATIKVYRNGKVFQKKITLEPVKSANSITSNEMVIIGPHIYDEELYYIQELQKWMQSIPSQSEIQKKQMQKEIKLMQQKINNIKNRLESNK